MDKAFLFPGQGSQHVGMGLDLYEDEPAARAVLDQADQILGIPLSRYCFGTGDEPEAALATLTDTSICQPALYTHSMAVLAALNIAPDMVAGHSVGEYAALCAGGALSFADGLRLVRLRGQLMADAGLQRPGGMAAVVGLGFDAVEAACAELSVNGELLVAANYNSPSQVVISGDRRLIRNAAPGIKARGARMYVPLVVSGAFHSPLVQRARAKLEEAVLTLDIRKPDCPVYLNVTGSPTTDPDTIRTCMVEQLTSPVRWAQTLQAMTGQVRFFEIGPGRVLSGLVRRTLGRKTSVEAVGRMNDLERIRTSES